MRLFSIIRFNIRLITFAKFVKLLKRSTVEADLNFSFSSLRICLSYAQILANVNLYMLVNVFDMTFNNSVTVNANIIAWIARKKLLENVTYSKTLSTRRFCIKKSFENLA